MNILFLNGSPRKNGYTSRVMKCIESGISSKHSVEWINVYDLKVSPCISCLKCRPNNECVLPDDDGHYISRKIRYSDALVIGSPTYFGNITGPLKTLIDRSLTAFEEIAASGLESPIPIHEGKKAAMVTSCNSPSPESHIISHGKGALLAIETILKSGGYDVTGSILLDGTSSISDIPEDIQQQARELGAKF